MKRDDKSRSEEDDFSYAYDIPYPMAMMELAGEILQETQVIYVYANLLQKKDESLANTPVIRHKDRPDTTVRDMCEWILERNERIRQVRDVIAELSRKAIHEGDENDDYEGRVHRDSS